MEAREQSERRAQALRRISRFTLLDEPAQGCAQVVVLLLQLVECRLAARAFQLRLQPLREVQEEGGVSSSPTINQTALDQVLVCVHAKRLEQAVAYCSIGAWFGDYQRLVDHARHPVKERVRLYGVAKWVDPVPGTDSLGRFEAPTPRKDRQPAEHELLVRGQQRVAP